jgi:hypothetical protein
MFFLIGTKYLNLTDLFSYNLFFLLMLFIAVYVFLFFFECFYVSDINKIHRIILLMIKNIIYAFIVFGVYAVNDSGIFQKLSTVFKFFLSDENKSLIFNTDKIYITLGYIAFMCFFILLLYVICRIKMRGKTQRS